MTADARVARSSCAVLRVGEEREVAGARVLDAGDAVDVDLAVAFEPAPETLGDVLELQGDTTV